MKQNHMTHQIEPKKTHRRVRDEEKRKEKEKSNLKTQKTTWVSPAMGGSGRSWSWQWCLRPWSQGLMGEGIGGGWVFFWREI